MKYLIVLIIIILINGCYSREDKLTCLNSLRLHSRNNIATQQIITNFKDSILKWQADSVLRYSSYETTEDWFFDDLVLFTSDSNRLYSWIFELEKDTSKGYCCVQLFTAERKNNIWSFYIAGMPTIGFTKDIKGRQFTKEELEAEIDNSLIKHIDLNKCEFEQIDIFINEYFSEKWSLYENEKYFWEKHKKNKLKNKQ